MIKSHEHDRTTNNTGDSALEARQWLEIGMTVALAGSLATGVALLIQISDDDGLVSRSLNYL